jgi:biopolymer transport protein ExbD/biopolymer transport protein TolR
MRQGRRRRGLPVSAEINMTSLVDVAFTLLVIFIITAPVLQGGVEVRLPRAASAPITSDDRVIVTIMRDGSIVVGEIPVTSLEDFERVFPDYVQSKNATGAYLKGDTDVPYGRVLEVLGLMKRMDIVEVGLVADPEVERTE